MPSRIKMLLKSSIVVGFLLVVSRGLCSDHRPSVDTGVRDTSDYIRGKVVDSVTNESIPFVVITLITEDSAKLTIVSNQKGEFSSRLNKPISKVRISAIGYQNITRYVRPGKDTLFHLVLAGDQLPNVVVTGKAKKKRDAGWIIKKVNRQFDLNYGDFSFDQKFKIHAAAYNYDTIKNKMIEQYDLHFDNDIKSGKLKSWSKDTAVYDAVFFNSIGTPELIEGDIVPNMDIIRKGLTINKKQSESFDFRLQAHYQDKNNGSVYLVSFKPYKKYPGYLGGRTLADLEHGFLKGEILIREDDFAIVSIRYVFEKKVEIFNRSLELSLLNPNWKANQLSRLISSTVVYNYEYSYAKDTSTGKYFVETIKTNCYQTGYQVEHHQNVQLHYQFDFTSLDVQPGLKPF
jgi:hypothetical protein